MPDGRSARVACVDCVERVDAMRRGERRNPPLVIAPFSGPRHLFTANSIHVGISKYYGQVTEPELRRWSLRRFQGRAIFSQQIQFLHFSTYVGNKDIILHSSLGRAR